MLNIVTFKWNSGYRIRYTAHHVNVLQSMVRRHYDGPLRFICVTDDPSLVMAETFPLWPDCDKLQNASGAHLPSCYRRLKLFDPETQAAMGFGEGDRIVSLDLDTVITGDLSPLFDRPEPFLGWVVTGTHRAKVFNGSMWMLRAGYRPDVWHDFDPETSPTEANEAQYLGSDQAWMSYRLAPDHGGWTEDDGVYSFPAYLRRGDLPENLRVAMFHGSRKPWSSDLPGWVSEHWRLDTSGRCLVLGYGESVWVDAVAALGTGRFDAVIASPDTVNEWRSKGGRIDALAWSDAEALMIARQCGFAEIVICGAQDARRDEAAA